MDKSVGPMCNPRLCLAAADERINYSFQVFFKSIATGSCTLDDLSQIERYLVQLSNKSGFLVCPGISEYPSSIRFKTKNLLVWTEPFERYVSTNCSQWHVPNNTRQTPNSKGFNCCKACKHLLCDVHKLEKRTEKCSESDRRKRLSVSSKLFYL